MQTYYNGGLKLETIPDLSRVFILRMFYKGKQCTKISDAY
jgi:hypothetical protein